ncbi:MAG: hypothetical protein MN733_39185 [Nitrososphaera sp.]|nr:hypothetical protein [Nitrososphaera sp.]
MEIRQPANQIFNLIAESYEVERDPYTESVLTVFVPPAVLLQLLAWNNGAAYLDDGSILVCTDWDRVPHDVLEEVRMTFFTSYRGVASGRIKANENGHYVFKSISTRAVVQEPGFISIRDPAKVKKKAKEVKRKRFPQ